MTFEHLLYEVEDGVATITINRPESLNSVSESTIGELADAFAEADNDESILGVIVTGTGEKSFVAGADISEIIRHNPQSGTKMSERGQAAYRRLETMGKPSIAAINGFALGGGCELAMACSIRIAAEGIKIGLPEVGLGVIPGYAGTQRLSRLVGRGVALELILTGSAIDANEAHRIGLVNQVVPREELMPATRKMMKRIMRNGPAAVSAALQAVDHGLDMRFEDGCKLEATLFGLLCATDDMKEGLGAFLEKRRPAFKGK